MPRSVCGAAQVVTVPPQVHARASGPFNFEHDWHSRTGDFELIRRFFSPSDEPPAYRDAAEQYGLSIPQLKSLLHRARLRFRALVEAEVLQTVGEGAELENEVNSLLDSLSR